jgi:hypothetical protein
MIFIPIFIVLLVAPPIAAIRLMAIDPESLPPEVRPNLPTAQAAAILLLAPYVIMVVSIIRHNLGG